VNRSMSSGVHSGSLRHRAGCKGGCIVTIPAADIH
jgi:hypothetical protein